jgi:hypothetical protein
MYSCRFRLRNCYSLFALRRLSSLRSVVVAHRGTLWEPMSLELLIIFAKSMAMACCRCTPSSGMVQERGLAPNKDPQMPRKTPAREVPVPVLEPCPLFSENISPTLVLLTIYVCDRNC